MSISRATKVAGTRSKTWWFGFKPLIVFVCFLFLKGVWRHWIDIHWQLVQIGLLHVVAVGVGTSTSIVFEYMLYLKGEYYSTFQIGLMEVLAKTIMISKGTRDLTYSQRSNAVGPLGFVNFPSELATLFVAILPFLEKKLQKLVLETIFIHICPLIQLR